MPAYLPTTFSVTTLFIAQKSTRYKCKSIRNKTFTVNIIDKLPAESFSRWKGIKEAGDNKSSFKVETQGVVDKLFTVVHNSKVVPT